MNSIAQKQRKGSRGGQWALAPQLFLNGCAACILAILSASAIQIRLKMTAFQSTVIKV